MAAPSASSAVPNVSPRSSKHHLALVIADQSSRHQPQAPARHFRCAQCGETYTSHKRSGPEGRGTLCNRCGLARAREELRKQRCKRKMSVSALITFDTKERGIAQEVIKWRREVHNPSTYQRTDSAKTA